LGTVKIAFNSCRPSYANKTQKFVSGFASVVLEKQPHNGVYVNTAYNRVSAPIVN